MLSQTEYFLVARKVLLSIDLRLLSGWFLVCHATIADPHPLLGGHLLNLGDTLSKL